MGIVDYLSGCFKFLENPISCLLFRIGFKKDIKVKPKNSNKVIYLSKIQDFDNLLWGLRNLNKDLSEYLTFFDSYCNDDEILNWEGINIPNFHNSDLNLFSFFELFFSGYWDIFDINFNNRCVIDIGSNGGDSSLYFAKNGAKVYGFEPVKPIYEYSLKILELNPNIKNNIKFFNFAVSDKSGTINILAMDSASQYVTEDTYKVQVITIEDIVYENDITPDILKMDCEGCEFNIILNSDLSDFNDIIFEHHSKMVNKDYNILIEKLQSHGFKIKKFNMLSFDFENIGFIHAYK